MTGKKGVDKLTEKKGADKNRPLFFGQSIDPFFFGRLNDPRFLAHAVELTSFASCYLRPFFTLYSCRIYSTLVEQSQKRIHRGAHERVQCTVYFERTQKGFDLRKG